MAMFSLKRLLFLQNVNLKGINLKGSRVKWPV